MLNLGSALSLLLLRLFLEAAAHKNYVAMPLLMLLVITLVRVGAWIIVLLGMRSLRYLRCRGVRVGYHPTCYVKL